MTENKAGSARLQKLEPIHERAAMLLMQRGSIAQVAQELGVHYDTVSNWKRSPRFIRYYRKLRREAYDQAIAVLQAASLNAVAKVAAALDWDQGENISEGGRPDLALQAARAVIDLSDKWVKEVDMVDRLEKVERKLKKQEN
jgi:hypothetical protein